MYSNSEIAIRPYQPSDEEAVVSLWRECGLVVPQNDPAADIARKLAFQADLFLVGLLSERLVATVMAGYEGHRGAINYLAVSPALQRTGIGRRIMQAAEDRLRALGCAKINLNVRTTNTQVIAFYKRIGYTIDDVVPMGKRLVFDQPQIEHDKDRRNKQEGTLILGHNDSQNQDNAQAPWHKEGWTLTFHDEFDAGTLDTNKWIDSYPHGVRTHSNNEQQYYSPNGYTLGDSCLRLIAENRPEGGMPYRSGMITSFGRFGQRYGWFEIRARFPAGQGIWPAFWLLPVTGQWPPEIDILEILGHEPDKVYFTNHWNAGGHKEFSESFRGPDFSKDFHTFAADWQSGSITYFVDGIERGRSTSSIPDEPMYVLANLAVGGNWPGMPDQTTPFPGYMDIDYIRVYAGEGALAQPPFIWPQRSRHAE